MATRNSFKKLFKKVNANNAAYIFVGGIVVLSLATLMMVITQPDEARTVANQSTGRKLYLAAPAQNLSKDSIIDVQVMADSGEAKVNAVQAKIEYPADKLLFYGIRQSAAFPVEAATNTATPGIIMVGRGTELGSAGISGKNEVVTLSFKVIADSADAAALRFDREVSMLVQAADNSNILAGATGTYLVSQ